MRLKMWLGLGLVILVLVVSGCEQEKALAGKAIGTYCLIDNDCDSTLFETCVNNVCQSNLIAYYSFNNAANLANDDSINGLDGVSSGVTSNLNGVFSSSAQFASGQTILVSDNSLFNPASGQTAISLWFKSNPGGFQNILSKYGSYFIQISPLGYIRFFRQVSGGALFRQTSSIRGGFNNGQWHHIVVQITDSYMEIYVDGVFENRLITNGNRLRDTDDSLQMGGVIYQATSDFVGEIDEVSIYTRPLTCGVTVGSSCDSNTEIYRLYHSFVDFDVDAYSIAEGDCNDNNNVIFPGASEDACSLIDNNCDGVTNPDYDSDSSPDDCPAETDDDNDGVVDTADACPLGNLGWISDAGTDHDSDGCRDGGEDSDDDNDGVNDYAVDGTTALDMCSSGVVDWDASSGVDYDSDGCLDTNAEDLDDDNDGVNDFASDGTTLLDMCLTADFSLTTDYDSDGCDDVDEDLDDDNDGVNDFVSGGTTALDMCLTADFSLTTDYDGDGCDDADEDLDDDNDDVVDTTDDCSAGVINWDGSSGVDFDSDGCLDVAVTLSDGSVLTAEDSDDDNDDVADGTDNCPLGDGNTVYDSAVDTNSDQTNSDTDVLGNLCDNDDDGDTILDDGAGDGIVVSTPCTSSVTSSCDDNCQFTSNNDQADLDDDGEGDACDNDKDGDTKLNSVDNCLLVPNVGQENYDGTDNGDACDDDDDNDGVVDANDDCSVAESGALSWTSDLSTDHDGDGCKDADAEDSDDDNDGVADGTDNCPLGDGNTVYDSAVDTNSDQTNSDTDVLGNLCDNDDDGDGDLDTEDNCPLVTNEGQENYDGTDNGDACDDDDDNDGVNDFLSDGTTPLDQCLTTDFSLTIDYDGDGCDDVDEDLDDDNDGVNDLVSGGTDQLDMCPKGVVNWDETSGYDHDSDGCEGNEDPDDDNDGVTDGNDDCVEGDTGWISNLTTDYDNDGCQDSGEDPDDDNDDSSDYLDCEDKNETIHLNAAEICDGVDNNCALGVDEGLSNCNDDGDTLLNSADNCPLVTNQNQEDNDGDTIGDVCDICSHDKDNDKDNDGICGDGDSCPEDAENDKDNDGLCGVGIGQLGKRTGPDNCPNKANPDKTDTDGDGVGDVCDNCMAIGNVGQGNADHDAMGDACDTDGDNDGLLNVNDNCDLVKNRNQLDSDGDSKGDVCDEDIDGDTFISGYNGMVCSGGVITDCNDNCVYVHNPDQADKDSDAFGNACDDDDDNDGIRDGVDNCKLGATGWISTYSLDHDNDGCKDDNAEELDKDDDGVLDCGADAICIDNPSTPDNESLDNDACPLSQTQGFIPDTDGDGCFNDEDTDKDGDGVLNVNDACPLGVSGGTDTDTDGCFNTEDSDDDNDGVVDAEEEAGCVLLADCDNDAVLDSRDNCPIIKNGMYNEELTSTAPANLVACDSDNSEDFTADEISMCGQKDSDLDGVGDACDNCATINNPSQEPVEGCGMCTDGEITTPDLNMERQKYFAQTCTSDEGEIKKSVCLCDGLEDDDCLDNSTLPSTSNVTYFGCDALETCSTPINVSCNGLNGEFCSNGACVTLNDPNPDGTCPKTDSYTYEKEGYTYRRTGETEKRTYVYTIVSGSSETKDFCVPEQVMLCTADKHCWLNGIDNGDKCVQSVCTSAVCKNGIKEPGEECDDNVAANNLSCSSTCQIEPGYYCTEDEVQSSLTYKLSSCQLIEDGFKTDLRTAIQTIKTALADSNPANDVQEKDNFINSIRLALQRLFR